MTIRIYLRRAGNEKGRAGRLHLREFVAFCQASEFCNG